MRCECKNCGAVYYAPRSLLRHLVATGHERQVPLSKLEKYYESAKARARKLAAERQAQRDRAKRDYLLGVWKRRAEAAHRHLAALAKSIAKAEGASELSSLASSVHGEAHRLVSQLEVSPS